MTITVAGCVAQAEGAEIKRRAPVVDLVVGPQTYHKLPELIANVHRGAAKRSTPSSRSKTSLTFSPRPSASGRLHRLRHRAGRLRQVLHLLCRALYARRGMVASGGPDRRRSAGAGRQGRARSHAAGPERQRLSWRCAVRHDAAGGVWGLGQLVRHLAKIGGIERIRFTTSHPKDMDDELIQAFADEPKLMPYFHLPVQAGSDGILKSMNRKHTAADYLAIIEKLREVRPDIAISGDMIVGFPGETDADFEATMELVRQVNYASCFSFKYSKRPGTPGAAMFNQVDEAVKSERLARLQALLAEQQEALTRSMIGKTLPVLFEREGRNEGQLNGRSPYLQAVHCEARLS
jgi:tRNA-2-methylthio-N6-dimethylallyladenosine synthase